MNHLESKKPARRVRSRLVALAAIVTVIGASCAPPAPTTFNLGPLTEPLPQIGATAQRVSVSLGPCSAGYTPPSFVITGATVTLPSVTIDLTQATATIPNVTVNIPAATIGLPSVNLGCNILGACICVSTAVNLELPARAVVKAATVNISTGVLTLTDPSFTITGVNLVFPGLGSLKIPLPDITIPLPTTTVPLK